MDNRKNTRLAVRFDAWLEVPGGPRRRVTTRNLSFGGAFVEGKAGQLPPAGAECALVIALQRKASTHLRFHCRAVHLADDGCGLQFVSIDGPGAYAHFEKMMVLNCPDPDLLLEELEKNPGLVREGDPGA